MNLSELQSLVGSLTGDPNHDRYSLSDINTELDNTQGQWNEEIKIIKETTTITVVDSQRQYALTLLTGTPLAFPRATHKGIDLKKRSKSYFDLYTSSDWTQQIGTPTDYFIEATDPLNLYITLYPIPQGGDAGANLVSEAIIAHTPMSAASDVPFMSGTDSNYILRPYDFYIAYSAAARLLARDASDPNYAKKNEYQKISGEGKELLINVFKDLEAVAPPRILGGRRWIY